MKRTKKRIWTMKEIVEDYNNHQNFKLHSSDVFIPMKDFNKYKKKLVDEIDHMTDRVICIPHYLDKETHVQYAYRYANLLKVALKKRMELNSVKQSKEN